MRSLFVLSALVLALPCVLPASEFDWMAREFARQSGTQQLRIPFFGLARFAVALAHPAGASDLKLAVFEKTHLCAADFSQMADATVGHQWKPIVRVHEKGGDVSNIYLRPDGKHVRLLIANFDNEDAVFVEVRIRTEELMKFIEKQRRMQQAKNHQA